MANIFDYLEWRGDLTLKQSAFNEVDNLILSRFSYFPLDKIIKENETKSILELYERFKQIDFKEMNILLKEDIDLFAAMAYSNRFSNMQVTCYINKIDNQTEKQFSAVTIILPDNTLYISYRGTDYTFIGWKEDFNMTFKSHIASQLDSLEYLQNIAEKYSNKLRIGGHSKGGNLAIYASVFTKDEIKKRIIKIYNNDGPGFNDDITDMKEYKEMIKKVHTYIPQSSIIGRLLNHEEEYTVVLSTQSGLMQHDLYTWQVLGSSFIHLQEVTNGSQIVDKTIKEWLNNVTPEEREQIIDIIFEILNKTNAKTFSELEANKFKNALTVIKNYKNIDIESKKKITKTLYELFNVAKNNIFTKK